MLVGAGDQAA
jgi:hypothetical protein